MKYRFAAFCRLSLSKPFPSSDTESSKPLSCKVKDIVTKVRAYRTALEIKLLHTCEINALSRESCKTDMSFCKINSFPFFVQMIFALSYKEARVWVATDGDLLCINRAAAFAIIKFYPSAVYEPAHHPGDPNYLNHYHLIGAHTNHIWFLGP